MTNTNSMDALIERRVIRIYSGMIVVFPRLFPEGDITVSKIVSKFPNCYAMKNSTIAFVYNGELYVAPYTHHTMSILKNNNLKEASFYVPFSNGEYPDLEKAKWDRLCKEASLLAI